jgi:hypothetical protein
MIRQVRNALQIAVNGRSRFPDDPRSFRNGMIGQQSAKHFVFAGQPVRQPSEINETFANSVFAGIVAFGVFPEIDERPSLYPGKRLQQTCGTSRQNFPDEMHNITSAFIKFIQAGQNPAHQLLFYVFNFHGTKHVCTLQIFRANLHVQNDPFVHSVVAIHRTKSQKPGKVWNNRRKKQTSAQKIRG